MIPANPNEWYKGLPFKRVDLEWREYMMDLTEYRRDPEPFLAFRDGPSVHELAHLIMVEDEHVLDPFWGRPFKDKPFESNGFGDTSVFFHEIGVHVVQDFLENFWAIEWERDSWRASIDARRASIGFAKYAPLPEEIVSLVFLHLQADHLPRQWAADASRYWLRRWDIHTIWEELQRKKRVVELAILNLGT